jgi:hypothetical protein
VSVFRGVALNLHNFSESYWRTGNGVFGARCYFKRKAVIPMFADGGRLIGQTAIVESLVVAIDDPFEILPFLQ